MSIFGDVLQPVGDLFGGLAGGIADGSGATSGYKAQVPPIQQQEFIKALQNLQNGFGNISGDQSALAAALLAQSQGQAGPNPAMDQLRLTTDQNNQSTAGLLASQRGLNPALAARMASQAQANANQQASGQAAVMRANQQLASQGQLQNLYGSMQNQNLGNQQILQGAQAAQNTAINQAYLGAQGINANTEMGNAQTRGQIVGGLMQGAGSAASMGAGGKGKAHGGFIEGEPQVEGDSASNDTVPIMASPGEIVIPRSKAKNPDLAKEFIDQLMQSQGAEGSSSEDDKGYGKVLESHRKLKERLARLEKKVGKAKK